MCMRFRNSSAGSGFHKVLNRYAARANLGNRDVALHNGRGLRDTQIHEMLHAGLLCGTHGSQSRSAINGLELGCLRRAGMGNADQLHKSVAGCHTIRIRRSVQSIAEDWFTSRWQLLFTSSTDQRANIVAAADQLLNQWPADIARPA